MRKMRKKKSGSEYEEEEERERGKMKRRDEMGTVSINKSIIQASPFVIQKKSCNNS